MSDENNGDVMPETLMGMFKGPGLIKMVVLTIVVHMVVILGSSVPHLIKTFTRGDAGKMSKDDRIKAAVEDASIVIRKIAEEHGLSPQDVSDQFASGGSRTARAGAAGGETKTPVEAKTVETPAETPKEEPAAKSAIEKKIETKIEGPKVPTFDNKKDDIF
jgi:hypothetical protein